MSGHGSAVARSKKRRHGGGGHEEHEEGGAERWLVTYADMLTLLLVLFIVLFSISVVNTSKFIALSTSLSSAFGSGHRSVLDGGNALLEASTGETGTQIVNPGSQPVQPNVGASGNAAKPGKYTAKLLGELDDFRAIRKKIEDALKAKGMTGAAQFAINRKGLVVTVLTNAVVFQGNSATLLSGGEKILAVIAPPLATDKHNVEVDGYTNQLNVSTGPYPSGWELSSARASAVVRYFIGAGVGADRLSAVGYSDQHPLVAPSNPLSVTRNRRVEIVVLTSLDDGEQSQLAKADQTVPSK